MSRYKTYSKALIIAALVILLCLICLSGATLALFTSNANDGTIGIVTTSGDVDIDIVDTQGVTLQEKSLKFVTSSGSEDALFEPGATFYTQSFHIKNLGDIPVNYSLTVSDDDSVNMQEFHEAFEIWIVRADDPNFENATRLTSFKGRLEVGEMSVAYHLFIKMKEDAGNEFQGKYYTGIGVTVYAVQGNVEIEE